MHYHTVRYCTGIVQYGVLYSLNSREHSSIGCISIDPCSSNLSFAILLQDSEKEKKIIKIKRRQKREKEQPLRSTYSVHISIHPLPLRPGVMEIRLSTDRLFEDHFLAAEALTLGNI